MTAQAHGRRQSRDGGLPGGAVTFVFTDIEGSTRLVKALRERYPHVLAEHRRLIRAAIAAENGCEVDTQGDAFFIAFADAKQAVLCALAIQRALAGHSWPAEGRVRVRIGIHTGHAVPVGGGYTGLAVHRAARISAAARGGQVLVSQATASIVEDEEEQDPGFTLVDLGEQKLKDLDRPVRLYQLAAPGLDPPPTPDAPARPTAGPAAPAPVRARHNLPAPLTSFVGRDHDLAGLERLLGQARLVTLTGPGGVGKTRLAGEVGGAGGGPVRRWGVASRAGRSGRTGAGGAGGCGRAGGAGAAGDSGRRGAGAGFGAAAAAAGAR